MSAKHRYYQESGKFGPGGILTTLGIGVAVGMIAGALYGALDHWNPFLYFNFLGTLGLAVVAGVAVGAGVKVGHVRNGWAGGAVALLVGLATYWASWVGWLWARSGREMVLTDPGAIWAVANLLNTTGVWSIRRFVPTGWLLWIIWGAELLIVVGGTGLVGLGASLGNPYCERCRRWADDEASTRVEPPADPAGMVPPLEAEDYSALTSLGAPNHPDRYLQVESKRCPGCQELHALTVTDVTVTRSKNEKGEEKEEESKTKLVENLLVPAKVHAWVGETRSPAPSTSEAPTGNA